MSVAIIIPARYESSRFPGKPLATLDDGHGNVRSLIEWSWRAAKAVDDVAHVAVATDDMRIADHCLAFGAEVIMTSPQCVNGTERCAEAAAHLGTGLRVVVNLQGDAPLTPPWFITALLDAMRDGAYAVTTPVLEMTEAAVSDFRADRAAGRVGGTTAVADVDGRALYFSKEVVPFGGGPGGPAPVHHHVGVYAYIPAALRHYAAWPPAPLESAEGLEQLRFIENGVPIQCVPVAAEGRTFWEVNNPSDIPRVEAALNALADT